MSGLRTIRPWNSNREYRNQISKITKLGNRQKENPTKALAKESSIVRDAKFCQQVTLILESLEWRCLKSGGALTCHPI